MRLAVPVLLALLILSPLAWGRAGGGENYSSGHSGGYSGGGDDDDGGFLVGLLLELIFYHPLIGVPVLLIVVFFWMMKNRSARGTPYAGERRMTQAIVREQEARESGRKEEGLAQIRQRDPGFSEEGFLARVREAFLKVQQAWSGQDMRPARAFVSDGVMERFGIQLEMLKARGLRNDMSTVNVSGCVVLEAESDAHFDTLHVCISASAVDTEVALADGRRVRGSGQPEAFSEVWSFLRRPGAQTLNKPGLIEGCCPNCGAGLTIGDAAQCGSCKSWINSGEYDWVLSEITQTSAFALRAHGAAVPGYAELAQRDPLLNTQFLEDRASVAFWRWQCAIVQGNAKALAPVATPQFCAGWDSQAQRLQHFDYAAVGAVEVQGFERQETQDLAHIAVRWAGTVAQSAGLGDAVMPREHVFVLARNSGVQTDAAAGLNSCRCPNCGAPPSSREAAACEYCGTPFNDGSRQWVLTRIDSALAWRAAQTAAPAPERPANLSLGWVQNLSTEEVMAVLICAMLADGSIDPRERKFLDLYAQNNHVPPGTVDGLIEAVQQDRLRIPQARTPQEAMACLDGLIEMSLADGKVDPAELNLILSYADGHGIDRRLVERRIKERRLALYQQAG
jgi:hypothetical protein